MEFRIADTFIDSLARLTGDEQKTVKMTAFDLQLYPTNPGMQFHKLDRVKDKNFWSVRASSDLRLIIHKTEASFLLCYVDHHDAAYQWAERRRLTIHPKTGAAQLVEIRQMVKEITVLQHALPQQQISSKPLLFTNISDGELLSYGVPIEWLGEVREANEDTILDLAEYLPGEAAEALLNLAVGITPSISQPVATGTDPFDHPDAQRRFRVIHNIEELERALAYPWEKWSVFLHPAQRELVECSYNGPARVSGSAGTGKTVVALHRAVFLARTNPDARVLLTTFSDTLANALKLKLRCLIYNEPHLSERVEVYSINAVGRRLFESNYYRPHMASAKVIAQLMAEATKHTNAQRVNERFLLTEWEGIVDAWQLNSWEEYRDVLRLGRKTRLPEKQRAMLWEIFDYVNSRLNEQGLITYSGLFTKLMALYGKKQHSPFNFIVIDEAQDISVAQLRFLAAISAGRPNSLFFTGDLGQRIFQQPFSWQALGIDVRGRSRTLRINYRTSHQIRKQADLLLAPELSDADGNIEDRRGIISVFNGPGPTIMVLDSLDDENQAVSRWLMERMHEGIEAHEIGVFIRSKSQINRAITAVEAAKLPYRVLDYNADALSGHVFIGTMHRAKGLEYRAVVVMACDDDIIPSQDRIETVADEADLEEVYSTERYLLYVACTRPRDYLLVTGVNPVSEFLDDIKGNFLS